MFRHPTANRFSATSKIQMARQCHDGMRLHNDSTPAALDTNEMWAINFAKCALSFNVADSMVFKNTLAPTLGCRQTIARATEAAIKLKKEAALRQTGNVTLCYDSGTVGKTFLFVSAASGAGNFVICARVLEASASENISEVLQFCKEEVERHGGYVVGMCANNASNMQAVEIEGVGKSRCAAHVLNLCVKEICESILKGEMDAVNALAEINADVRAPCPTRWCYQFERFASAARR